MSTAQLSFYDATTYSISQIRVQVVRDVAASLPTNKVVRVAEAVEFFRTVVAKAEWFDAEKECVVVLILDRKCQIRGWNLLTLGTQSASLVSPVEVLRVAIVANAQSFIVMHNHPSGDPAPSHPDMHVTRLLREASKAVGLTFADHVIVGTPQQDPLGCGHFSFNEAGII